ncbi:copper homeostasis membrane protein CopD [Rhizobium calliandrae]|uniref:Copper homeostasis membrane protein CopD n=1 Tax=Rhizobium calliandrae TaxID=1312182 RepID=A0ABT7KP55_9HYPH|nr:copper homeostasis membrane protein CopD [Rhizobium calliandrae]MDL2410362.1 copper homeostasis membrane protein CopD [Rhizobium calliandrae]
MIDPSSALQACRFFHDASLMLLWGGSAFLCLLVPKALAGRVWRMFGAAPFLTALTAGLATVALLPLETAIIGNGWSDAFDAGTIQDVLFETTVGQAWQAQAAAALILVLAFLPSKDWRLAGVALGSGLGLAALTLTGHASMHEGWLKLAHRANDILHLLTGGGWLGALVPLIPILRLLITPECREEALLALRRFSTAGHGAVAMVIASGIVNTMLVLRRLPIDWSSSYQALLAIKIALVAGMSLLAIVNRYVFVPRIRRDRERALSAIRLGAIAEVFLGIAVIALVAVLGVLEPV